MRRPIRTVGSSPVRAASYAEPRETPSSCAASSTVRVSRSAIAVPGEQPQHLGEVVLAEYARDP
jgi:hypothetical protein